MSFIEHQNRILEVKRSLFCFLSMVAILACLIHPAQASELVVLALFKDKVVLVEDGKHYVLNIGDKTPFGAELVSANSQGAVFKMNGKEQHVVLGNQIQTEYSVPSVASVTIIKDSRGMYRTSGRINGNSVDFLVDSGAQLVAMNTKHAESLGLAYSKTDPPVMVDTASGQSPAYVVVLNSVSVGSINVHNVKAIIIENDSYPKDVLLGMSFLKSVELTHKLNQLHLQKK